MNTLKYKGYISSVAYSKPHKVFFGKLEGIDDFVNYEGEGVKPEKSYSGSFNVRLSPDTHRSITRLSSESGVSINSFS